MARDRIAINAFALFGKPLNKGSGVGDFAFGFRQRFALFQGHQTGEIVLMFNHQVEPAAQDVGPLFGG